VGSLGCHPGGSLASRLTRDGRNHYYEKSFLQHTSASFDLLSTQATTSETATKLVTPTDNFFDNVDNFFPLKNEPIFLPGIIT